MFFLFDYVLVFSYFLVSLGLGLLMLLANYIISPKFYSAEKHVSYECGFDPFDDARLKFNVHYYLVAILFIVFDLEIIFLFPWALNICCYSFFGFFVMVYFLFILTLGFLYEWLSGALDW